MPIPTGERPFDRLAAELAASPVTGSFLGLTAHDGALPDMSPGAVAARERASDEWRVRFAALPDADLNPDERVDRDLVVMVLTGRQVMRDWQGWRRNPDDFAGPALNGLHILLLHGLRAPAPLAAALTARLEAVPDVLAAGRANLEAELAAPELVRRAQGMARAGAPYVRSLAAQVDEAYAEQVAAAAEPAAAAFEEWATFLEDLAGRATGGWAIGESRHGGLLRHAEGLDCGARELRERGAAEWVALAADMRRRTGELRGDPGDTDWRGLLDELNAEAPATPEEMRAAYQEATDAARASSNGPSH